MGQEKPQAIVVGAGVIGLTSALALEKQGWGVTIVAGRMSPETTSDIAAAVWFPFVIEPAERALPWARQAYGVFERLAREEEGAGVALCVGLDLFEGPTPPTREPWWQASLPEHVQVRLVGAAGVPEGFGCAWEVVCPVIEMARFMPWLHVQCALRGIRLCVLGRDLPRLRDALEIRPDARLLVNCSGLGAAALVRDPLVVPVQGQIVHVRYPTEHIPTRRFYFDEATDRLAYVIPLTNHCVLGGTARVGAHGTHPDPAEAARIRRDCARIEPALADAPVLRHLVGLRPGRSSVRLEIEWPGPDCPVPVVHNYGHGGNGVTVCFGCAEEVVQLADKVLAKLGSPTPKM